jgi:methyltransferase
LRSGLTVIDRILLAVVFIPMIIKARVAAINERAQRRRGGVEAQRDVYRVMSVAYPGVFLAMIREGAWRPGYGFVVAGAVVFTAAKALKYWAIGALGEAWTFRVIVRPGLPLVTSGPYRWLRHPNYVAVAGELAGVALMSGARIAGPLGSLFFILLMYKRISVEERALEASGR